MRINPAELSRRDVADVVKGGVVGTKRSSF